jgi:histidinol-phosphate/aromatic aminotransferase/cobyric acid decarboxylase-like protein
MTPTLGPADPGVAGCGLRPPAPADPAPDRAGALGAGGATDVLTAAAALEAAGRHVVHLEVGEPDAPTPPHVVEAGVRALRAGHTRYGPPAGIPELRAAIAESLRARGVPADPARVVVSPGAKAMIFTTLLAAVRPGDEVLVPDPGYPAYASVTEFAGGRAVRYPLRADDDFAVDPEAVAARCTPRTRVLVLNAPHNPTGGVVAPAALARLAGWRASATCSWSPTRSTRGTCTPTCPAARPGRRRRASRRCRECRSAPWSSTASRRRTR